ncbi:unnamed protein product [Prorocentrum cordatum]|uniref:Uncharacterized protein n=1 Tax=Prorocentrum cordatum TaxID=2364126 RepID=A0ABN9R159_9DINO|nr:unnamed protein product [Polarella glacialis]
MASSAEKRVGAACEDLARLEVAVRARVHVEADQALWSVLQRSISRALDYDMRVCPWEYIESHAWKLEEACWMALGVLLSGPLDAQARAQAMLPGALGGLALGLPTRTRAAATFQATHAAHAQAAALLSARLRRPHNGRQDDEAARRAAEVLRDAGVDVRGGEPTFTMAARRRYEAGPWHSDTPTSEVFRFPVHATRSAAPGSAPAVAAGPPRAQRGHVHGRTLLGLDALAATELHAELDVHRQTSMLQAGGPGSGSFWSTVPDRPALRMANSQWAVSTKCRLGICRAPEAGLTCVLQNRGDDEPCGAPLDSNLHHPTVCRAGAGRLKSHTAAVAVLMKHLRATGAFVALEAAIPELYLIDDDGVVHERFMDLVVWWPGGSRRYLLDVTIRSLFAAGLTTPHLLPGAAAREGEKDKTRHYRAALQALATLHRESAEFGRLRPGTTNASALALGRLRADLEAEVARHAAQTQLAALGGMSLRALGWATSAQQWRRNDAHGN